MGLSRRALELAFAALLVVLAGLVLWDSLGRGAGWAADGPQSGYFPARIGFILLAASLVVLWSARRASREVAISWGQLASVLKILVPLTIHVALIEPLGIYVPSAALILVLMLAFGSFRWWQLVLGSVPTTVVLFLVFEVQFGVPLPKGPLEAWLGY